MKSPSRDLAAETGVEAALLADAGDRQPAIIVGGIKQARIGQAEDLLAHRAEHGARITLLEVGSPAASNEQAIAGERHAPIVENVGQTTAGVARCRSDLQVALAEGDGVVGDEKAVGSLGAAGRRESDPATGSLLQHPGAGDVIGMDMGFERIGEAQA